MNVANWIHRYEVRPPCFLSYRFVYISLFCNATTFLIVSLLHRLEISRGIFIDEIRVDCSNYSRRFTSFSRLNHNGARHHSMQEQRFLHHDEQPSPNYFCGMRTHHSRSSALSVVLISSPDRAVQKGKI